MRIVSGDFRGKALIAPDGQATRPTSDRARQAIFNILDHAPWAEGLEGVRVIDLFAGSGAIGVALLKNLPGTHVDFGELDPVHLPTIQKNVRENLPAQAGVGPLAAGRGTSPPPAFALGRGAPSLRATAPSSSSAKPARLPPGNSRDPYA